MEHQEEEQNYYDDVNMEAIFDEDPNFLYRQIEVKDLKVGEICIVCPDTYIKVDQIKGSIAENSIIVFGFNVFEPDKRRAEFFTPYFKIWKAYLEKKDYEVADIDQHEFPSLWENETELKTNVNLPDDQNLKKEIISAWNSLGEDQKMIVTVCPSKIEGKDEIVAFEVKQR